MKKIIILIIAIFTTIFCCYAGGQKQQKKKWYEKDRRIEVVNETTVIFRDVVKIDLKTRDAMQITYIYDLKNSELVKAIKGGFSIELKRSDYLVQSNKKITKTVYDVIIE